MAAHTRRRQQTREQGAAGGPDVATPGGARGQKPASGGGIGGWLRGAGKWIGDKYDATTEAVGGFIHDTGQAAQELWDVATSTDVSLQGGNLVLDTDLDELMDVMPASARAALQLDRGASANRVHVVIDPGQKTAVLTSDEITVAGVRTEQLQTGAVQLRGVTLTFSNPGGGIPFVGGDFSFLGFKDADDNLRVDIDVKGLAATDVRYQGPDGPTTLASLEVDGLTGSAAATGGAPMGEGARTNLDFSVEGAVLQGLAQKGVAVGKVEASGVSGGMYEGSETAFLEANHLGVSGAVAGGQSLGDASVAGARVDVQNKGGGLVGLDGKADHLAGRVRVSTASVSDFDGESVDVRQGRLAGLGVAFDADARTSSATVDSASVTGLDTASLDVDRASFSGLTSELDSSGDRVKVRGNADTARVSGVRFDGASAADSGGRAPLGLDWGLGVRDAQIDDVTAAGASVDRITGRDVQASGVADGSDSYFAAQAGRVGLQGLDHDLLKAQEGRLDTANLTWATREDAHFQAARAEAAGVSARNFQAGRLGAQQADFRVGGTGDATATLGSASVSDVTLADRVVIDSGRVDGVTATAHAGERGVAFDAARVEGVADRVSGATIGSAGLTDVKTTSDGQRFSSTIGGATLADVSAAGGTLSGANLSGARVQGGAGGAVSGSVDALRADGIAHDAIRADRAAVDGLGFAHAGDTSTATARGLSVENMAARNFSAASLDGGGASVSRTGGDIDASLDTAAARSAVIAGRTDVSAIDASGIRAGIRGDTRTVDLASATVTGLSDRPSGASVDAASLSGASLVNTGGALDASLASATARGISAPGATVDSASLAGGRFSHAPGQGPGGPLTTTLRRGLQGPQVVELQRMLQTRGLYNGALDGDFGSGTERAVVGFQRSVGLTPDGIVGADTRRLLQGAGGPGTTTAGFDAVTAGGVALDGDGGRVRTDAVTASGGQVRVAGNGSPAASLDRLQVNGTSFAAAGGGTGGGAANVDTASLVRSGSRLVDDADIRASMGLTPGKAGPLTVDPGTTAAGRVVIRDNRVDTSNTRVDLSRPVDGPVWTSVNGIYGTDDNRLKADVNGWFDQDVGGMLNKELGLQGKGIHSVGTMGDAAARKMGQPGASSGGSGVAVDDLRVSGSASLRGGTLDAGQAGSVTLADAQRAGQNEARFSTDGRGRVVAGVADLLTRGFTANTDAGRVAGGDARVTGAEVIAGPDGVNGSVDALDARDLRLNGGV